MLTPVAGTDERAVERLTAFWEALGSHVRRVEPDVHDRGVAAISHFPHLVAFALVAAADDEALAMAGPGFHDTTRIAGSAEGLWTDIFRENRAAVLDAVARYRGLLDRWEALVRAGDWDALEATLARARARREKLG
jgi:prephenate dehydrogenase